MLFLADWLNLLLRWGHLISGIAWIGTSFYFVALDFCLRKREGLPQGVSGEAWEVHGGGFYNVRKYLVAPPNLPPDLIWFKWEAYLTWVTGFLLLIVQYYLQPATFLIDPNVMALTPIEAIAISIGSLIAGWLIYDWLNRSTLGGQPVALAAAVFGLILVAAWGFTHVFSGRGAFIHAGAFIGTIMAANVFMVIIPNQRKAAAQLLRGEAPDPKYGLAGKQRSLHNTYLTLPVLLMMISNHYANVTDGPAAWLVVGLVVVGGVALRHFLVRHEVGDPIGEIAWTLPIVFGALLVALWLTNGLPFDSAWLNLLLRWGHMIAGIAWIGTSFYFVALDYSLKKHGGLPAGVSGEAWEVHGGGFYNVQKYLVAPPDMPPNLIWFKWEAYLTWVTGFLLLIAQYYWDAAAFLIDPSVMPLQPWQAIAISVGSLVAGWLIYDALNRSPLGQRGGPLALCVFALILLAAWGFAQVFSGRGAFIHTGAFIGTIMAANVFMVIIPNQRKAVAQLLKGEAPDSKYGLAGKQRSLHNTYLTLPVLLMMISNHYPFITDHPNSWLLVGLIVLGGAMLRYYLVSHEVGTPEAAFAWSAPVIMAALAGALWMTEPAALPAYTGTVTDDEALALSQTHCTGCHAAKPTRRGMSQPPKGVALETVEQLRRHALQIEAQAVRNRSMPLGNETGMTIEERGKLGAWIAAL